jgi:hypothetical protein
MSCSHGYQHTQDGKFERDQNAMDSLHALNDDLENLLGPEKRGHLDFSEVGDGGDLVDERGSALNARAKIPSWIISELRPGIDKR